MGQAMIAKLAVYSTQNICSRRNRVNCAQTTYIYRIFAFAFPNETLLGTLVRLISAPTVNLETFKLRSSTMAKPHRKLKKANHGRRPANAKARKAKRKKIKC